MLVKAVRFKDIMTRADGSVTNYKNSLLIEQIHSVNAIQCVFFCCLILIYRSDCILASCGLTVPLGVPLQHLNMLCGCHMYGFLFLSSFYGCV